MEENVDLHRKYIDYDEGDWIYTKLQPYRHTSLADKKRLETF